MCDSNRVKGTVKQYLVTDDNDIVVNDLGTFSRNSITYPDGSINASRLLSNQSLGWKHQLENPLQTEGLDWGIVES